MRLLLSIIFFVYIINNISAQTSGNIVTDRPDVTESAVVVPLNHLQIESGFVIETDNSKILEINTKTLNTTLLRYGLLDNFELRFGLGFQKQGINNLTDNFGEKFTNYFPLYAGFKLQLPAKISDIDAAVIGGFTNVLYNDDKLSTATKSLTALIAVAQGINDILSIGYNFGGTYDIDGESFTGLYSASLAISIIENLGGFVETYGTFQTNADFDNRFDAGLTYLLMPNLQLDISTGIGITDIAPDNFISGGISYRIPN